MPHRITRFEPTPNPNALKCHLDPPLPGPRRSYRKREEADEEDPIARAIFAIDGVAGLLVMGDWLTVNKHPEAGWAAVKRGVQRAVAELGSEA